MTRRGSGPPFPGPPPAAAPRKARQLRPAEAEAWRRVSRSVTPLDRSGAEATQESLDPGHGAETKAASASPAPASARSGAGPPARLRPSPEIRAAPGHGPAERGHERRVRRGQVDIHARFDLHGHSQASAARALPAFLSRQQQTGARCVLVITGKGRIGEGVLRRRFLDWMATAPGRRLVSGYAQAHPRHGGAGAFYVFLRRPG